MSLALHINNHDKIIKYAGKQTMGGRKGGKDWKAQKEIREIWAQLFIKSWTGKYRTLKSFFSRRWVRTQQTLELWSWVCAKAREMEEMEDRPRIPSLEETGGTLMGARGCLNPEYKLFYLFSSIFLFGVKLTN